MPHIRSIRRCSSLFFLVLAAAISLTSLLPLAKAYASGESYTFTGSGTIDCSGGACTNPSGGADTILNGGPTTYTGGYVVANNKFGCQYILNITLTITGKATGATGGYSATVKGTRQVTQGNCGAAPTLTTKVTVTDPTGVGPNNGNPPGGTATGKDVTQTLSCNAGFNPLNWLLCGAISGMVDIIQQLDNFINDELSVGTPAGDQTGNPTSIFGTGTEASDYKAAWTSFRDIALALMVIAAIIVVLAQALGFEILDAYTIRKVLPRLLLIAIAITLSWSLMQFFVQLTNDLGYGIRSLIYSPFSNLKDQLNLGGAGGIAVTLATGTAIAAMGIFGLFSFVLTGALAVFVAFLVLIIRQIVIIILIIVAPVALVMYILPNTQRVYQIWWDAFSGALLMFPIIAGIIAAGRVFSAIAVQNVNDPINQIIGFAAYFAPYFLIPATFKFAGGAISRLGGFVNDRHRGAFDGLRNFRSNQTKQRRQHAVERAQTGNTFKRAGEDTLRNRLNRGIMGATLIGQAGVNPATMRSRMRTAMNDQSEAAVGEFSQNSKSFNMWSGDDAKLSAARFNSGADIGNELARFDPGRFGGAENSRAREDAVSQIMRTKREVDNGVLQKARVRAQAKTGTGYQRVNPATGQTVFDATAVLDDINSAYGNDRNGAGRALAEMKTSLTNSGQVAGAAGYGTWGAALERRYKNQSSAAIAEEVHNTIMDDAIDSATPGQAIYGKPTSAAAFGAAYTRRIQGMAESISSGRAVIPTSEKDAEGNAIKRAATVEDLAAATASAAGVLDAMGQASPLNASAYANEMMSQSIAPITFTRNGSSTTVSNIRELIDSHVGDNPEWENRRRDIMQSSLRQAEGERERQMYAQQQLNRGVQPGAGGPPSPGGTNNPFGTPQG